MRTLKEERRLKKIHRLLEETVPAVNYVGMELCQFNFNDEGCEIELIDAELLMRLAFERLKKLDKSIIRKLRNSRPRKVRRAVLARKRLAAKDQKVVEFQKAV